MTALTTIPAPALGAAPRPPRLELPADHRLRVGGRRRTHRFPAPTYLSRSVAREERAIAQEALEATDRSAARRVGSLGAVVALLFGAALFLLATGRADTPTGGLALVFLGGLVVVAVLTLVGVLRRHEREHDVLTERVRIYDARLLDLRPRR